MEKGGVAAISAAITLVTLVILVSFWAATIGLAVGALLTTNAGLVAATLAEVIGSIWATDQAAKRCQ